MATGVHTTIPLTGEAEKLARDFQIPLDPASKWILHGRTTAESAATIPETPGGWQVWLADPPWREEPFSWATGSGRAVERHYGTMTIDSIKEMGPYIKARSAPNAMLFLWVTWPFLMHAPEVAKEWGFRYSSNAWVWVKGHAAGGMERGPLAGDGHIYQTPRLDLRHGRGHTTRKATEICLLFRRGAGVPRASMAVSDVLLSWPEGRNSRKPVEQYQRIEDFLGPGLRRIELFARKPHRAEDWEVWGSEA